MVEQSINLDLVFRSLADPTRRDILERVSRASMTVGQIAEDYKLTFAAVSKHLKVMEKAGLITKQRSGKERIVSARADTVKDAAEYLKRYEDLWNERYDQLDELLKLK